MKKLVSIVLALIMVFSLATVAFAEGETQDYTVLKNAAKFVWGIYQKNFCKHQYIVKGWTENDKEAHTHTYKKVCAICGDVVYETVPCAEDDAYFVYENNGMTKHYTCRICKNEWEVTLLGHTHKFEATGYYESTEVYGVPMHYQVYECSICGYETYGIPTLCLPLTDSVDEDHLHDFRCPLCYREFLTIPTAEKVIRDVTDTIKYRVYDAVETALNENIDNVLQTVFGSLTDEQKAAVQMAWDILNNIVERWTPYYTFNADNAEL